MDKMEVPGYTNTLLEQLEAFRTQGMMCDMRLCAKDGEIQAHKLVLISSSPYLAMLLAPTGLTGEAGGADQSKDFLQFETVSVEVLTTVVSFLYTGKLCIDKNIAEEVKKFCEILDMKSAVDVCEKYIENGCLVVRTETHVQGNEAENDLTPLKLKLKLNSTADLESSTEAPVRKKRKYTPRKLKVDDETPASVKRSRARKPANPKRKSGTKLPAILDVKHIKKEIIGDEIADPEFTAIYSDADNPKSEIELLALKEDGSKESMNDDDMHVEFENNYDSDTDEVELDSDFETENSVKKAKGPKGKIKPKGATGAKRGRKSRKILDGESEGENTKHSKKRRKKPFPCAQCSKVLSSYKRKVFHEFSKHGTPFDTSRYSMVPCKEAGCKYVAANRHNLDTHMKSRHGVARPHICEFCGKGFKLPNILATHINIHTGKKNWKCDECGEGFNQQSGLDVHIKRHHMGEASWAELCHLCSEKFMLKSELAWHLFKAHKQPLPENYKVYDCEHCSFMTKSCKDFERHENIHKGIKKHICPVCQKACSTKSELRRHVGFHGEKKYKCNFEGCSFACTDSIGLDKHIKLMHTHKDYKPYACPVCQYRTGVRGNVDKHIRTVHDLVVVTKHTVQLKMKYPQFSSGDVITKDGQLIATSAERKALQQVPPVDKDGNLIGGLEGAIQAGLNDYSNMKSDKPTYQKYKHIKRSRYISTAAPCAADIYSSVQSEVSSAVVNMTQASGNSSATGVRDFAALSNYVYIHGDAVMTSLGVPMEAQDLRLQSGSSTSQTDQPTMYSLGNGDLFLQNKLEYQEQ